MDVPTIFHVAPYSLGTPIHVHFWGHLIGGASWEPLMIFLTMGVLGWVVGGVERLRDTIGRAKRPR